jgi:hypothetical protein
MSHQKHGRKARIITRRQSYDLEKGEPNRTAPDFIQSNQGNIDATIAPVRPLYTGSNRPCIAIARPTANRSATAPKGGT